MARPAVFYAWQADRPRATTRDLIRSCAASAIAKIAATGPIADAPRLDHDTLQKSGTPPIAQTIFQKIKSSAVFLGDVTFTADTRDADGKVKKRSCNDNITIELGYAAATIGWGCSIPKVGWGSFCLTNSSTLRVLCASRATGLEHWFEADHLKPFLKGSLDIRRYGFSDSAKQLIFPYCNTPQRSVLIPADE